MTDMDTKKTIFVAMPFGTRSGFLHHSEEDESKRKTIKFDGVWKGIIEKSLPDEVEAIRADELRTPGIIDRKYIRLLYEADVVLADLTFANPNVYYEVGIRQALRQAGTVLIACKGTVLPFDLRNQTVLEYPYDEAPSIDDFRVDLRDALLLALENDDVHSPVHTFIPELKGVIGNVVTGRVDQRKNERLLGKIRDESKRAGLLRLAHQALKIATPSTEILELLAIKLRKVGEFDLALEVLEQAIELNPDDPEVLREIGFCYRKKGRGYYDKAEIFLKDAVSKNSHDFEALGMLGGLAKRRSNFSEALSYYESANKLEPDELYTLVTLGAIHAVLGNPHQSNEFYSKCETVADSQIVVDPKNYWAFMCKGESSAVNGNADLAIEAYKQAIDADVPEEDLVSALEQLEFLCLLYTSPSPRDKRQTRMPSSA